MVCVWSENDSSETKFLANKVEEYGFGISCNVKDELDISKDDIYRFRNSFNQQVNGYRDFANYIKEY